MTVSNHELTPKEKEFVKYHARLRGELNSANWHFAICKHLQELGKTYLDELNVAPAFFRLTRDAHALAAAMRLNRFFDKGKGHLTVYVFLDFVEQNLDIFSNQAFEERIRGGKTSYEIAMRTHTEITSQIVEQDRQRLDQLPIDKLRKWRNKALAHIQKEYVLEDINVFKQYPLTPAQVDEIINTLHEILNRYSNAYESVTWSKELYLEHGMQEVMEAIRFKIGEKSKRRLVDDKGKS